MPSMRPACYEGTDLAFKVRRGGYKVLYQPLSEVIHYEAPSGTDPSRGTKTPQEVNRLTFVENWATELAARPADGIALFDEVIAHCSCDFVSDKHMH